MRCREEAVRPRWKTDPAEEENGAERGRSEEEWLEAETEEEPEQREDRRQEGGGLGRGHRLSVSTRGDGMGARETDGVQAAGARGWRREQKGPGERRRWQEMKRGQRRERPREKEKRI